VESVNAIMRETCTVVRIFVIIEKCGKFFKFYFHVRTLFVRTLIFGVKSKRAKAHVGISLSSPM